MSDGVVSESISCGDTGFSPEPAPDERHVRLSTCRTRRPTLHLSGLLNIDRSYPVLELATQCALSSWLNSLERSSGKKMRPDLNSTRLFVPGIAFSSQ
jgi:hypothetical protein